MLVTKGLGSNTIITKGLGMVLLVTPEGIIDYVKNPTFNKVLVFTEKDDYIPQNTIQRQKNTFPVARFTPTQQYKPENMMYNKTSNFNPN